MPDEEEQFLAYRQVTEAMPGLPVIIRTLDLGADKQMNPDLASDLRKPCAGLACGAPLFSRATDF